MSIIPQHPPSDWLAAYLEPSLLAAKPYAIDTPDCHIKLDQNEAPWDWPEKLKARVLDEVGRKQWNRYPSAFADGLTELLARHAGVPAQCVLTTNGSNVLISLIINLLGRRARGDVVIARPSFALYESHCQYEGIAYKPWKLTDDLEYDEAALDDLRPHSLVVFASPNNPVGNALSYEALDRILRAHGDSYFVADEAYFEFSGEPYTPLLGEHRNLIVVRTLSKTMGAAGLRIGYAIAAEPLISCLKKTRLPYLLNHFAVTAGTLLLSDPEFRAFQQRIIEGTLRERQRLWEAMKPFQDEGFSVKRPFANFLLLRFSDQDRAMRVYQQLINRGILIRNVSGGPGMVGCLRATVGSPTENDALLTALGEILR